MFGSKAQNIIIVKRKAQLECLGHGYERDLQPGRWQLLELHCALAASSPSSHSGVFLKFFF